MKNHLSIIGGLLLAILLFSCNNTNSEKNRKDAVNDSLSSEKILEEIEFSKFDFDIPFDNYLINSEQAKTIITESGSEISIPANAFVFEDGTNFSGEAEIKYRELISAADIIASNVNMKYDSAGVTYDFQTAGMFEIEAYANGQKLVIKEGQKIDITFGSQSAGSYGFYHYEEDSENWKYEGNSLVSLNKTQNTTFKPLKPTKLDQNNDIILEVNADYNLFPELKMYDNILWKYTGDKDVAEINNIFSKKIINSELVNAKNGKYLLEITTYNKTKYEMEVAPVFSAKNFQKAENKFNTAVNNSSNKKVKRQTSITQLGLSNYDRFYHNPNAVRVMASFSIKNEKEIYDVENISVFLITGENDDVIIKYEKKDYNSFDKFNFDKTKNNKLVAILPNGAVATLSSDEFPKSLIANSEHTFVLNELETPIKSVGELDNLISNL